MKFVLWRRKKDKSTEIVPPLLLKLPYICTLAMPRAKKGSNFKEDDSALQPFRSYYSICFYLLTVLSSLSSRSSYLMMAGRERCRAEMEVWMSVMLPSSRSMLAVIRLYSARISSCMLGWNNKYVTIRMPAESYCGFVAYEVCLIMWFVANL